jgi:type I restriction enzyme S subunit
LAGEIPRVTLEAVTDMLSGGTPSKAQPDYWGGNIPWVSAKDMKERRLRDTEDHITPMGLANGSKLAPASATLILTRGMTLLTDVPICTLERDLAFNQDIKAIVPRDEIDPLYLAYVLRAMKPELLSMVELAGHGTGRLPTDRLKGLEIPLPDKGEQRVIAYILGTLDDKIELNRRMNETLEAMVRALFKSWFVDFDPVRAKMEGRWQRGQSLPGLPAHLYDLFPDRLVDSELGEIPAGWEVKSLDEIARFLNGLALQRYPPTDEQWLPVIKIAQLRAGNTIGADRASADIEADYIVQDGDLLFSWSGSLECVLWAGGRGALNQHLFKVTSDRFPRWLCYLGIHHHLDEFRYIAAGKATTMGHIQRHHLSEAKLPVPQQELLRAMDLVFQPIVESIWHRAVQSRNLATLRDALLPKLISGELRIEEAERFLKECGL